MDLQKLQQTNPGIPWFDWWWRSCPLPRWVWRRTTRPGSRCPRPPSHPSHRPRSRRPHLWSRSPCPGRTWDMEDMRRTRWRLPPSECIIMYSMCFFLRKNIVKKTTSKLDSIRKPSSPKKIPSPKPCRQVTWRPPSQSRCAPSFGRLRTAGPSRARNLAADESQNRS